MRNQVVDEKPTTTTTIYLVSDSLGQSAHALFFSRDLQASFILLSFQGQKRRWCSTTINFAPTVAFFYKRKSELATTNPTVMFDLVYPPVEIFAHAAFRVACGDAVVRGLLIVERILLSAWKGGTPCRFWLVGARGAPALHNSRPSRIAWPTGSSKVALLLPSMTLPTTAKPHNPKSNRK